MWGSIALLRYSRSYESSLASQATGSARLEASYVGQSHGKNAYDSCLLKAVKRLGGFLATYISWIFSGPRLSDHAAQHKNSACQYALAMWGPGLAPWLGCGTQSRGGSLPSRHYVASAGSNRKRYVPRLHLPNVWEVESGNEVDL